MIEVFAKFKTMVERQSGHKIKTLRSDCGGEYVSRDFDEVFAPVVRIKKIRLVVVLANINNWYMCQVDVKYELLNGTLYKEVYVAQRVSFVKQGQENKVYMLDKAMYGLKQALRVWNEKMDDFLRDKEFVK